MAEFNVLKFEELIERRGRSFVWERARRCPCWDPIMRRIPARCPQCNSIGYTYTRQGTYRATILGITGSKQYAKLGEWILGDAVMTFPAALLIGDHDRIILPDAIYRESHVLVKGQDDQLVEPTALEILECSDSRRAYQPGRDFDLLGQQIAWKGAAPAEGTSYSVIYTARPVYVVWLAIPQVRVKVPGVGGVPAAGVIREMPRKVALRRWVDWLRPGS